MNIILLFSFNVNGCLFICLIDMLQLFLMFHIGKQYNNNRY